eukprot:PhF_6_TR18615/c0_g1_i1/m.27206/K11108/RCL1; RNA 3'-terminal phosphate cyclase-like protein
MIEQNNGPLQYEGGRFFRYQLACSLLSTKPVTIQVGRRLTDYETNLLRFVDRISTGTQLEVSEDASTVTMRPGVIVGGTVSHPCAASRGVGYILELAALVLPFAKNPSEITLTGATNNDDDVGIDVFRTVTVPLLRRFGLECGIKMVRRGCGLKGSDGQVVFTIDNVRFLNAVEITDRGKIKRVRGIAFGNKVAPDLMNRCATSAKGVLLKLLPDVYVVTDGTSGKEGGAAPGYGVCLVTESTNKVATCSQEVLAPPGSTPEDVGKQCAFLLLDQVYLGGCVDQQHQMLCLFLMSIARDVPSKVRFGTLTDSSQYVMNSLVRDHFGVAFVVKDEANPYDDSLPPSVIATCIGCKLINAYKRSS